jgi:hypothetical protein
MRCDDEIRADGVAPVPVADAHPHSQQSRAEHPLPPTSLAGAAGTHPPKNALGCGASSPATSVELEALDSLDQDSIQQIISVFELLDRWDRGPHAN